MNEEQLIKQRAYRHKNRDKINANRRGQYRNRMRGGRENFPKEEYKAMLKAQGEKCASCGTTNWGYNGPCIDHNHKTGKIRGVLCNGCNSAEGHLNSDPIKARALADYMEKCEAKEVE